jgi:hypothetical protein
MTDDITRGLGLLADEAEPATIDTQRVITRARARTRNRRASLATAFATVALVGALVVAMGPLKGTSDQAASITDTTLEGRLNRLLTEALPGLIPAGWSLVPKPEAEEPQLEFVCLSDNTNGCNASATYDDGAGDLDMGIHVDRIPRAFKHNQCGDEYCDAWAAPVRQTLPDGTKTQVLTSSEKLAPYDGESLLAFRPDGTMVSVYFRWPQGTRSEPPLTTDQMLEFATVFSYDSTLPVASPLNPPTTEYVSDDPEREGRVNQELTEALGEVIPAAWSKVSDSEQPVQPPFAFDCAVTRYPAVLEVPESEVPRPSPETCWSAVYYRDATGIVGIKFSVAEEKVFDVLCDGGCSEKTLSDGTEIQMANGSGTHTLGATRPDGTHIWVEVYWQGQRSETPLSADELLKFATAFTF